MDVLGISTGGRGSAVCLVRDGRAVAAAREEWFTRVPFDASFPEQAIVCCLETAGGEPDAVVRAGKTAHRAGTLSSWLGGLGARGGVSGTRSSLGLLRRERAVSGARAAAASAFFPSPFEEAAILVINGPGSRPAALLGVGHGTKIRILAEAPAPHTPAGLYTELAEHFGRRCPHDEPALIDLARLGRPRFVSDIRRHRVEFGADGLCRMRNGSSGLPGPRHAANPESITPHDLDWARSIQTVVEDAILHAARRLQRETGLSRLVFAGDAALNAPAVGRLVREGPFDEVWIPASPADTALGAALNEFYRVTGQPRDPARMAVPGPEFTPAAIGSYLEEDRVSHKPLGFEDLCEYAASALADGRIVGWFQGPAPAGSRGLGARAVLADPRSPEIRNQLNTCVKRRGSFRTFAACIPAERANDLFDWRAAGPHAVLDVPMRRKPRRAAGRGSAKAQPPSLPGVLQPDGTVTLHAVDRRYEPHLHRLLKTFAARTGCPLLLATSLCAAGEPVAVNPRDAYEFFMRADLDFLALGPFLIDKRQQPLWEK